MAKMNRNKGGQRKYSDDQLGRIQYALFGLGWSQWDVARLFCVHPSTVSRIYRWENYKSYEDLVPVRFDVDEFLSERGEAKAPERYPVPKHQIPPRWPKEWPVWVVEVPLMLGEESMPPDDEHWRAYSVLETCAILGIGRTMLYGLIRRDGIRTMLVGRRRLIPRDAVRDFLRSGSPVDHQ